MCVSTGCHSRMLAQFFMIRDLSRPPNLEHSENEERWFSIGLASSGAILSIAYLWKEVGPTLVEIRLISARKPTVKETRQYQEGA